jgi:citrate lyase subunit beta-like protein
MAAASIVRRSLLYVPGSSAKFIEKSRNLSVDCIAYDLEDSVAPGKKVEARKQLRHLFEQPRSKTIREQAVRINSVDSGLALDDLTEVVRSPPVLHGAPSQRDPDCD